MIERFPFAHINLGPPGDRTGDPQAQAAREVNAIGNNILNTGGRIVAKPDRRRRRPKAIVVTEALGYRLPELPHYGKPIRSFKTEGHKNLALYLRDGLEGPPVQYVQHKATWPKVNNPNVQHAPRVTGVKRIYHGPTVVFGHGPQAPNPRLPDRTNAALREARDEWVDITARIIRNHDDVIWLGDPNYLLSLVRDELDDPHVHLGGDGTDGVLVVNYIIESDPTPGIVNGVPMLTDHHKCLLGRAVHR